jgi:hypothetical protein
MPQERITRLQNELADTEQQLSIVQRRHSVAAAAAAASALAVKTEAQHQQQQQQQQQAGGEGGEGASASAFASAPAMLASGGSSQQLLASPPCGLLLAGGASQVRVLREGIRRRIRCPSRCFDSSPSCTLRLSRRRWRRRWRRPISWGSCSRPGRWSWRRSGRATARPRGVTRVRLPVAESINATKGVRPQ